MTDGAQPSPAARRAGWALTGLASLFLAMDTGIKLAAVLRSPKRKRNSVGRPMPERHAALGCC